MSTVSNSESMDTTGKAKMERSNSQISVASSSQALMTNTPGHSASSPSTSTNDTKRKMLFTPEELKHALMPTLEKLFRHGPESHQFRQPVDPMTLGIPDYYDIIKRPMDLSTIRQRLECGAYSDPWEYVKDVWLMFDNAWLYNRKTSGVYRFYTNKLAEVFESEIDPVMQGLGYCCGRKYTLHPQTALYHPM